MKEKKLSVLVWVTVSTHAALQRVAKASGNSMSGFAGSFLDEAQPVINSLAEVFEKAKDQRSAALDDLQGMLIDSTVQAGQAHLELNALRQVHIAQTKKKNKGARRGKST